MAVNGNSTIIEFGKETTYGTGVNPTNRIEVSSEAFKFTPNKTEEGLLTGRLGGSMVETMSIKSDGSLSTLAKPESVGYFLKGVLGSEVVSEQDEDTEKYTHTFTPIGNGSTDYLPSYTFTIDRKVKVFQYTGVVFDSVSFSAQAEDRLKLDLTCLGKAEATGTINNSLAAETAKSFKFHQGKVKIDDAEVADVTSISLEYKNNCSNYQSTDTGLYFSQPQPGKRECTATLETIYTTAIETIREDKFKTDDVIEIELSFKDADDNEIIFTIPYAQISTMDNPTANSSDTLKQSITVNAIDQSDTFVSVELVNDVSTAY